VLSEKEAFMFTRMNVKAVQLSIVGWPVAGEDVIRQDRRNDH
jgi:hypothetical protein